MALLSPTFLFGVVVLLYLTSFVFFAILRILTGISIQRIGYFSLRRLAYTPKDGVRVEIRGFGLNLHRPTFVQPTWVSIVLEELAVIVDLPALDGERKTGKEEDHGQQPTADVNVKIEKEGKEPCMQRPTIRRSNTTPKRSKSWDTLTKVKERIKKLHRNIRWLRLVDVVATNASITITEVGTIQVGRYTMAVDTRRKTVDRGRMFSHGKADTINQRPAEWKVTIRSVLFTPEGKESMEVLDLATLNVHGLLYQDRDGLRDAAIALKLGRVHVPYDDIQECLKNYKRSRKLQKQTRFNSAPDSFSVTNVIEEIDMPGSREERLMQTVSDSKEFVGSVLRGIEEVQFAVSYVGLAAKINYVQPSGTPMYLTASMKEVGVDLHRLDPRSPAHRMYFSSKDIAHQALVAALSICIGVDNGSGESERLVYIPMATTTVRTTLPCKTVEFAEDRSADERNANILFANVVITSPSIDLDPKHLPLLLAIMRSRPKAKDSAGQERHVMISRLLPKANIKFSLHEPVIRIALPAVESDAAPGDFDLIISTISSVSLDVESSHSSAGELHYGLASNFRVQDHDLYYQTSSNARHDLLQTGTLEIKVQVSATPEVYVVASANLQTFSIHMVRPEISDGVRQIVRQLRAEVEPDKKSHAKSSRDPNFIRAMPSWLLHFQLQASDFSAEVAGIDKDISDETRGLALQLESWSADYRAQKDDVVKRRTSRRRAGSRSLTPDGELLNHLPLPPKKKHQHATDGRRLAVHVKGFEAFIIESAENWEANPFLSMPRFEVAVTTSSDNQGPIFHINTYVRSLLIRYSLYRHYSICVATMVLRNAFVRTMADKEAAEAVRPQTPRAEPQDHLSPLSSPQYRDGEMPDGVFQAKELVTVDVKITLVQVKANMPVDPPLMLQIYGMEAGRHRWSPPFIQVKLARLYVEAPKMKHVWARIASIKRASINLREFRQKSPSSGMMEDGRLIDVNAEAIRLAVPHQVVLHNVFDNVINTMKATAQLHHRFKTGTNEYILHKTPEGPKNVPNISLRSRALIFELEDGAFEWKLGSIYRTGLVEQQQRLAREEAFQVKAKKIEEEEMRRGSSRYRNRSAHPRGRSQQHEKSTQRSKSDEGDSGRGRHSRSGDRGRKLRYDPEGMCGMTGTAKISIQEARENLHRHNAQSWKKRIDHVYRLQEAGMKDLRGVFWGPDELPDDMQETENILAVPQRPALMATLISDLHVKIGKPSFPMKELPDFLYKRGKGMPRDTKYSLLIPMHVQIDMGEARVTLRDYPLPLLHVPATKPGQSSRLPSWSLKTDFVIAEEFRGPESTRRINVNIIPPSDPRPDTSNRGGFAIEVRRTVSAVKSFSDLNININTGLPTRITWGASYQPAIQDMMMIIETFTKPQVDPSERTGFWDKIRLSFHSRAKIAWTGDGDIHLLLKGTRDPYLVTGDGAGFVMCWRNDIRWNISVDDDPRKFMTVDSGEYVLAVPDLSHQARDLVNVVREGDSVTSRNSFRNGALFKKVVMKLSGNVQWMAGLSFERNVGNGKRSSEFKPHYEVMLKNPEMSKAAREKDYDAFSGFRSHHIHMSVAVSAPVDRDWSVSNAQPSRSYNTVHLSPRFFSHFFAWWGMFSGTMSLPIRQGRLFPGIEKSSKKFGRHLATIKYNLLLAPLFISHIYKHKDAEDYSEDVVSATGLKIRLDSFMLDLHQRREEFPTQVKGRKGHSKTSGMKMHRAQLDLLSADIRAVSASIAGTTPNDLKSASKSLVDQGDNGATDLSRFVIPDHDFSWIDMDDFVELDWILPSRANPDTKIMPLAFAPRFTYFRETDNAETTSSESGPKIPFGKEETHFCIMSQDDDPRRVQIDLIKERLAQLDIQRNEHEHNLGDAELKVIRDDGQDATLKQDFEQLKDHGDVLRDKKAFLESMMHRMAVRIHTNDRRAVPDGDADRDSDGEDPRPHKGDPEEGMHATSHGDFISDFNNRFVIHNMQMKWNNSLRNIILRYIHQVSQRRGFMYYLSRRAVKFILDIVEEQNKAKAKSASDSTSQYDTPTSPSSATEDDEDETPNVQDRINEILADGKKFVNANDPKSGEASTGVTADDLASNIAESFSPQSSYHLRLIAPQIQLQSEKNAKSVVLVTAKGMELKVIEVMDKNRIFDDVSGLVQRRFSVAMDSTQFFVTHQKVFSSQLLSLYSGSRYGTPVGSAWPPWVPMEVMFDFQIDPFGFKRVVQKTSASLRYDKYNTLRLKYNDEVNGDGQHPTLDNMESRIDHLWVEFPQIRAICDSSQYYAMYQIVLDLLLYSEPLEKTRSERLEKIMLASDFSDLRGAPEMVIRLQERIKQLDDIKTQFQINSKYLDKQGWEDRMLLEQDLTSCEDELFFMMKAITTAQRKYDGSQANGLLRWHISSREIVWHLMNDETDPLVEFQLKDAVYERTDNSDGSHVNQMQISKILGLNLLPNAIYPQMITPYFEKGATTDATNTTMLRVYWNMLEAIAGIPVMDHFEVNLFPMKIQLEREVGKKLFEYIFPDHGKGDGKANGTSDEVKNQSPFVLKHISAVQDDEDDLNDDNTTYSISLAEAERQDSSSNTRAGSLEIRLRPTMNSEATRPKTADRHKNKASSMHSANEGNHFRIFQSSNRSQSGSRPPSVRTMNKKSSYESLPSNAPRSFIGRSATNLAAMDGNSEKSKRFGIVRKDHGNSKNQDNKPSDDLTKMMNRASNYMTLAYAKIPSVVLCLSYKGRGERNIEDVHDFVFRMPMLEYRNKTWSNLDLALALKKDVIKALISHTGAIIGNKFSKHRPNGAQQSKLRELANSSMLLPPASGHDNSSNGGSPSLYAPSDSSSIFGTSPTDFRGRDERPKSPRRSFASSRNGNSLMRTTSHSSSVDSMSLHSRSLSYGPHGTSRPQGLLSSMAFAPMQHAPSSENDGRSEEAGDSESLGLKTTITGRQGSIAESTGEGKSGGFMLNNPFGRKLGALGSKIRDRDGSEEGGEAGNNGGNGGSGKRKGLGGLGKKILGHNG